MIKDYLTKEIEAKNERKAALDARLTEINKRTEELAEINERSCDEKELKATAEEIEAIKAEIAEKMAEKAKLDAEIKELEAMLAEADKPAEENDKPQRKQFLNFEKRNGGKIMTHEELEARAKDFAEKRSFSKKTEETRAILISSGSIATPTEVDNEIRDTFNHVPSIVDMVDIIDCEGMGSYKIPYEIAIGEAAETTEGDAYNSSDPSYGYKTLTPKTYTILSQLSKQVLKQSPVKYLPKVEDSAFKALREKAATVITNKIIASDLNTVVNCTVYEGKGLIDEKTLRKIAMSYGTDETVVGAAVLQLTKADLIAFGDVRSDTTLQAVYEITPDTNNPNTGIIKDGGLSVKYILNPNLTPINGVAQGATAKVGMIYGQPKCCALGLFSGYEVQMSEDFAFNKGMLTIRGDVELDADVVKKNGFVAFTLAANV